LAAGFSEGEKSGLLTSFVASIVGLVLSFFVYRLLNGGFMGGLMSYAAFLAACINILRIPARTIIGFSIILLALQIAILGALLSFGLNVGKLFLA
jgi:hypothetical protein